MNRCFQIVMLQKTPESPLFCKEIKPVNFKGNEPWIFIRRTDAEVVAPILWPTDAISSLTGKDSDAEKYWEEEMGVTGWDGWIVSLTQWREFEQTLGDSKWQRSLSGCSPWITKNQTWFSNLTRTKIT